MVELGYAACSKVHVFRGDKDYTTAQVQELLGLIPAKQQKGQPAIAQGAFGRFLMPLSECEDTFTSFLEELRPGRVINVDHTLWCRSMASKDKWKTIARYWFCYCRRYWVVGGTVTSMMMMMNSLLSQIAQRVLWHLLVVHQHLELVKSWMLT